MTQPALEGMIHSSMRCPRCNEADLVVQTSDSIPIESCPACHGIQVGLRDLRRVAEALAIALVGKIELDVPLPPIVDPIGKVLCRCGKIMDTFPYLGLPQVKLDRCEDCMLVWLDAEELTGVAQLCAQSEGRIGKLYEAARKDRRIAGLPGSVGGTDSRFGHDPENHMDVLALLFELGGG